MRLVSAALAALTLAAAVNAGVQLTAAPAAEAALPPCLGTTTWSGIWGGPYTATYPTTGHGSYDTGCFLGPGADNEAVSDLQWAYNECYARPLKWEMLTIDGEYGDFTAAAIDRVQRFEGIRDDGVYGPQTRENMRWPNFRPDLPQTFCFDNSHA